MSDCSLCGLPAPEPPVTDDAVEGTFCCQGCLHVARTLGDADPGIAREELADGSEGDNPFRDPETEIERADPGTADLTAADSDTETAFLSVDGMHCATCERFLESRATADEAVRDAAASYPAGLVKVAYDPTAVDPEQLPDLLDGLGYRVHSLDGTGPDAIDFDATTSSPADPADEPADRSDRRGHAETSGRTDDASGRLLVGAFFGMMAMCWYALFLYPSYLGFDVQLLDVSGIAGQYLLWNVWLATTVVLGYTGSPLLRGAYVSLRTGLPNMDLLVALAAVTAYVYSALVLALGGTEVYFDVAIVIVLAVTIGNAYEDRIRRRAAATLTDLTEERASVARRRTEAGFERVAVEDLNHGDEVVIRDGERIPVDGRILEGSAAVDESLVTGESVPVRREPGDDAVGGALVAEGGLVVEVIAGDDGVGSTTDRLVALLWDVQTARSGTQRLVDRLAALFVPLVATIAVLAASWHLLGGVGVGRALLIGLSVLVVSCPCALGLATPLAVSAGIRSALDRGVVLTDGSAFERAAEIETVAFDKTGTLTTGSMRLLDCESGVGAHEHEDTVDAHDHEGGVDAHEPEGDTAVPHRGDRAEVRDARAAVLERAAALEQFADHPIAEAITDAAPPTDAVVTDASHYPGAGVGGVVDGEEVLVGRRSLFADREWTIPDAANERYAEARRNGDSPAMVGWEGEVHGVLAAGDRPRPGWESVVADLARDHRVVVISGDDRRAADRFGEHPGVESVFAGVPPEAKAEVVERLQAEGPVAMVGDGSNDAPALATADLGLSLERGTQLAADAADAVVTTDDLRAVTEAFDLLGATRRRIRQNLAWALCYNAVAIPLAVTGLLNPLFAAVAMAASSLLVVGNSARTLAATGEGVDDEIEGRPTAGHGSARTQ